MDATTLADRCTATVRASREALGWVADPRNARKVSQERHALAGKLRRIAAEAERLGRSVTRPNCVGVFGPSQAGKSYLISILARKDEGPLVATFAGDRPEIDFIRDINPIGGDESTGVITRFTIKPHQAPPRYPVCLRLLSQSDIVKILVNSYFQDGDQEYETAPQPAALEQHLKALEDRKLAAAADTLTEDDVWDIQDYLQRHSAGAATASAIEPFWSRIAALAPLLGIDDRAALLSVLWGRHETYTGIYRRLTEALAKLGFAEDVFCGIDALIPSRDSIINVNALAGLDDDRAPHLAVSTAGGTIVSLPRPVVTALIAELRIVCRDRPLPFFEHTDLLDFPGYRSRFKSDLKRFFRDAADTAPREVFLRGKVDYLFQRYTGDLELTTMVLCIPDSTLEVPSLPKAIETWVGLTHGRTPEKRFGKPTLLFFAMTKFDRTLERKAGGEEGALAEKFEIRFGASLGPFAKIEPSWVRQWAPGQPFQNVFLIRNPNVQFMGVIDYEGVREIRVNDVQMPRLEALRQAFTALPTARQHFADPAAAWDALMVLNDGGAGRLARALERVCDPLLKLGQVATRLADIRGDAVDMLSSYHSDDDYRKRRADRLAVVDDRIFPDLDACAERNAFGTALRGLMIDATDLYAALTEALARSLAETDDQAAQGARSGGVFSRRRTAAAEPTARPDRASKLAGAALSAWATLLHARIEDAAFSRRVAVSRASLKEIVAEIGSAARRLDLADRIATELKRGAVAAQQNEAVARQAAMVAERIINRFVSELDFDRLPAATQAERFDGDLEAPVFLARPVAYDVAGIGAEQPRFAMQFMQQWGEAFRVTVAQNAASQTGSPEDANQNARLGEILGGLTG